MGNIMKKLLEKIRELKVLIIGDLILDHYIWGDASRISPEAPVPVIEVDHDSYTAGGAANVALNIRALGATAEICGVLGNDDSGLLLKKILAENNVPIDDIFIFPNIQTILKTRIIARQQQLCRLDRESTPANYKIDIEKHKGLIIDKVKEADVVIFSDYAKGVVDGKLIKLVQKEAKKNNTLITYDPKPIGKVVFKGVDILKPNRLEALELSGIQIRQHDEYPIAKICESIWKQYHPKYLIISLGADGMLLSEKGKIISQIPTYAREVFDVSGAGDSVIASLSAAVAAGSKIEEAVHFANIVGGVVVGKVGATVAYPNEIIEYASTHV